MQLQLLYQFFINFFVRGPTLEERHLGISPECNPDCNTDMCLGVRAGHHRIICVGESAYWFLLSSNHDLTATTVETQLNMTRGAGGLQCNWPAKVACDSFACRSCSLFRGRGRVMAHCVNLLVPFKCFFFFASDILWKWNTESDACLW